MKVAGDFHLTYCSNIHPGESWREVNIALEACLPRLRELLACEGPLGIGLRLSAEAAETLENPGELAGFGDFLSGGNYYVFTINGFPYGAFHGQRVKERVYLPDWRSEDRVQYTNRLARLLAALLPQGRGIEGSVSSVPGAFRSQVRSDADVAAMASGILRHAAHLVALRERTGATITLALEPEPACYLETIDDAVSFFQNHLFSERAVDAVVRQVGVPLTVEEVRRHVGVCLDVCHMAVAFEDPSTVLRRLHDAGIRICKVQISSALLVDDPDAPGLLGALGRFADDTYLHQVIERRPSGLVRYTDLPEALASAAAGSPGAREWRIHFHVPIFRSTVGDFGTTQAYAVSVLDLLKRDRVCPYFEVETYTWDVLPAEFRTVDACTAIAREVSWARAQLES